MVQVDIFWSFAFGAGFAASAVKQLEKIGNPFESRAYVKCLTWLALFFVPSGTFLLWAFPRWETMQVGTYETIPAWLVALFAITNITQGMIGFWLVSKFVREKKYYLANLMSGLAWFVFWFILVHGWDGTGFKRCFYCATDWSGNIIPWVHESFLWYAPLKWVFSPVAVSLMVMGLIMMPFLIKWMLELEVEGRSMARDDGEGSIKPVPLAALFRVGVVDALLAAIAASIVIHLLGWILGLLIFLPLAYLVMLRDGGVTQQALAPRFVSPYSPAPSRFATTPAPEPINLATEALDEVEIVEDEEEAPEEVVEEEMAAEEVVAVAEEAEDVPQEEEAPIETVEEEEPVKEVQEEEKATEEAPDLDDPEPEK